MRIVVTGNQGYVGAALARRLRSHFPSAVLVGLDSAFFAHILTAAAMVPERLFEVQLFGDVRDMRADLVEGVDAVVHLAAVSNDPMGQTFEAATDEINRQATLRVAQLARDAGVKNFVFASSCSVYGFAPGRARVETDPLNPQTAYARSKVGTERALAEMDAGGMVITSLRFATACGMSDRLRLDLILNDFVACAVTRGEISVLSDGTPWRPLIDVRDMARAIEWAVLRKAEAGGQVLSVNVGTKDGNYQVRDIANAVAAAIPGTSVSINSAAPADTRSYTVDFSRFESLAPAHRPAVSLAESIKGLEAGLRAMGFADREFRSSSLIRLNVLQDHIVTGRLAPDLRWAVCA